MLEADRVEKLVRRTLGPGEYTRKHVLAWLCMQGGVSWLAEKSMKHNSYVRAPSCPPVPRAAARASG